RGNSNGSGEDEVAQPDVRNAEKEGYHSNDGAVFRELPEPDRIAVALRDPDHDDIRAGANHRGVPAEVRAQGERPPEHGRARARWGVRHELRHDGSHGGDVRNVVDNRRKAAGNPQQQHRGIEQPAVGRVRSEVIQILDDADLGEGANEDEQAHEDKERLRLHSPAPRSATIDGSVSSGRLSTKPAMTNVRMTSERTSNRGSLIASRSVSSIT